MSKYNIPSLKSRSFFLAFIVSCVGVLGISVWSSSTLPGSKSQALPQVVFEVEAFKLVGTEKKGDSLILRLKNVSGKGITAYSISYGPKNSPPNRSGRVDTDYAISGHVIAPGEIEEAEISIRDSSSTDLEQGPSPVINIAAVVFEDHTSEGDFKVCATIRDRRLGEKIQIKRINRLLREALKSETSDLLATLSNLEFRIQSLSEIPEASQGPDIKSGLHDAKQLALTSIGNLKQQYKAEGNALQRTADLVGIREGLGQMIKDGEGWLERY